MSVFGGENILRFQIPVDDLSIVDVLDGQAQLREPIQNSVFWEIYAFCLSDDFIEISPISVLHDYIEVAVIFEEC